MSISSSDLKHALRKTDFPFCAREALNRIEQLWVPQNMGRQVNSKHVDLAVEIMAEFVFCEIDRRGGRKRRLTCIQELQLLEVLCDYFAYTGTSNDNTRNSVFTALFPPANADRCRLLAKLVSMAISTKNTSVLSATGAWMQQLGCASRGSLELAEGLVKDYFVLVPRASGGLQDLPQLAPHFTASFLTAVAEMYTCSPSCSSEMEIEMSAPPQALLEVVTQWVSEHPTLCMAALLASPGPVLASGPHSIATPFAGLFRWCVLAPLQPENSQLTVLYSRLHLALLESVLECRGLHAACLEGAVPAAAFRAVVGPLSRLCVAGTGPAQQRQQAALDRLAQALQLALDCRLVAGAGAECTQLLAQLDSLPPSRLLQLVLRVHAPPTAGNPVKML